MRVPKVWQNKGQDKQCFVFISRMLTAGLLYLGTSIHGRHPYVITIFQLVELLEMWSPFYMPIKKFTKIYSKITHLWSIRLHDAEKDLAPWKGEELWSTLVLKESRHNSVKTEIFHLQLHICHSNKLCRGHYLTLRSPNPSAENGIANYFSECIEGGWFYHST
jgi:hypothetical protein